ncbi:type II toxin-antitoxin system VapC family toxin [cf. Phormidesmis sp. LEGE 11477]|uniref:type II toxin-antitoxin system VapC family toxin n=1 Tax=cf. Phormidesmis sp. LEGE 11477 TaxID=1828680 RepID=UPI001882FBDF|nr:type II toxin-antitoxin system VapC family toxin [cf. Phormidesmis sp. LEGE 11477]MBE9062442.1 type II toxin-antitoxin system VapC family toxin [cf. Phormidesmis sp. LEGE 11477]
MYLCDVNIYINAHREENVGYEFYHHWLTEQLSSSETFLYCDWILSAFIRIVTHPRIYKTPTPLEQAIAFTNTVRSQPNALGIMPGARHWQIFEKLCLESQTVGNLVPDASLAALAIESDAVWVSADADFKRFEPILTWQWLPPK